jgi:NAD-dependent deacetylase
LSHALRSSAHIIILTGAGVSAESGIPTFRDAQTGLWARYRPEDLATPAAFERDPALVWQWYQWRRDLISRARPNAAHLAIAGLERLTSKLTLITQNVDGLHQQAGSRDVIEFHGNIHRNRCSIEHQILDIEVHGTTKPPRCPNCGARVRPDVVWFGESIPSHALLTANAAAVDCDLFLSVGTSSVVEPAAGLAALGRSSGAMIAEINSQETMLSPQADVSLRGNAGSVLPALVAALG